MPIKVLPSEVISKIAAGEVVERPASVVKELIENSLDAQASQITIEVKGGGLKLIRVIDNGIGIPSSEVELAFQRYTTSKIYSLQDLENITTLGFRGEALPSIAAVSQVEIFTQTKEEPIGTFLSLKDGQVIEKRFGGRSPGTTVVVRNLFKNFPARLKFLKSPATENSHIINIVSQYALAFPETKFSLYLEDRLVLRTSGDGDLRSAVAEVYGVDLARELKEVSSEAGVLPYISGLISHPSQARSSRSYLSFFVNRRWVRSPVLYRAVEDAYSGLLSEGKYPIVILNIFLPPQDIDINVHPTKAEVKFRYEGKVYEAVYRVIREALGGLPLEQIEVAERKGEEIVPIPTPLSLPLRVLGQVSRNYIIAEGPEGLYLIDQHAAHERIIYERILSQQKIEVQGLLQPLIIDFSPNEEGVIKERLEDLAKYGFTLEPFGHRTYILRTVPTLLKEDWEGAVREIISSLAEGGKSNWQERIAVSLSCRGAIKSGQPLSQEEMMELVRELERTKIPGLCPHGRPTMLHLSSSQLEKGFGRR